MELLGLASFMELWGLSGLLPGRQAITSAVRKCRRPHGFGVAMLALGPTPCTYFASSQSPQVRGPWDVAPYTSQVLNRNYN